MYTVKDVFLFVILGVGGLALLPEMVITFSSVPSLDT